MAKIVSVSGLMVKATCLVLLLIAVKIETAAAAPQLSCGTVMSTLAPCFEYVLGGGAVPDNCCKGVKSLYEESSTTAERRNVCGCLKGVTSSASAATIQNAGSLPGKCGISIPYKISPSIDCNTVK